MGEEEGSGPRLERIGEFVVLADQILDNPAVQAGLGTTMSWERTGDDGSGTWSLVGPNEHLIRSLLMDLRNVVQPGAYLELSHVIDDLAVLIGDPEAQAALDDCRRRYQASGEVGITTVDGRRVRPAEIVKLWMYAIYHHRDRAKLRRLRTLEPFVRMVERTEFIEYIRNICHEVVALRKIIDVSQRRGFLAGMTEHESPRPPFQPTVGEPAAAGVIHGALVALLNRAGGSVVFTPEELRDEVADASARLGGRGPMRINVTATGTGTAVREIRLAIVRSENSPDGPAAGPEARNSDGN